MSRQRTGCVTYNQQRKSWVARLDWSDETGKRRCRKKHVDSKSRGRELIKKWIRELAVHGTAGLEGDRITFEKLAEVFEDRRLQPPIYRGDQKVTGLRSWKDQRGHLKVLREYFGRQLIRSISYHDIEKFKQKRLALPPQRELNRIEKLKEKKLWTPADKPAERSLANIHRTLALLRQLFTFAEREGWIAVSPFKRGAPLISAADEAMRDRVLSRDEEKRLLAACTGKREHLRGILLMGLDCGLRRGEILKLKWSDVNLDAREVRLRSTITKTARSRVVGITSRVYEELQRLWEKSPQVGDLSVFGITDFKNSLAAACEEAKIENFKFHDTRHTFITRAVQQGLSIAEAMKLAGHTTLQMHARYTNIDQETAKRGRLALDQLHEQPARAAQANQSVQESELIN